MQKHFLLLVFFFVMMSTGFSQQLERPKKQASLISEIVAQIDKATGWTLQNNGAWISAQNKIPFKEYSLNRISKGRYLLGIENFTNIEVRQVIVLDQIYSILIIKYQDGNYEFPILEQNWTGYEALKYYVFNQNKWNKILPATPEFNKPYAVNMNLLCSGIMPNYNEKTYLFEIENQIQKAVFQREESVSNMIFAVYPIEIAGEKIVRFKIYETLNKKELYVKYLLNYNWEKLFKSHYYEIKFTDFKTFIDDIFVIDPKRLADINYYLTFMEGGVRNFKKEKYVTASQNFSKALLVHPPDTAISSILLWRGKAYQKLKLFDQAKVDFNSILIDTIAPYPDPELLKQVYYLRGNCNYSLYDYNQACKDWQKAAELGSDQALKLLKKNCGKNGDSTVVLSDSKKSIHCFNKGLEKFEDGKYLKSLFLFEDAWKFNPSHNDYRIPYYIGVCRYYTNDFVRAIDDFEKAIVMKPDENSTEFDLWIDAFVMRGKAWQKINYNWQACDDWRIAQHYGSVDVLEFIEEYCSKNKETNLQTTTPDVPNMQIETGIASYENGNYEKSIVELTSALESCTEEESFTIYNFRASAKHKIHDYQGAIADFSKAIEKRPSNQKYFTDWYRSWFNRGISKYFMSDFKGACADWQQAIEMGLEDIEALYYYNNYCEE